MTTFEGIVAAYKRECASSADQELRWFAIQPTLESAVSLAAMAQSPSGKRFSHQRRIPGHVLSVARAAISSQVDRLASCTSFDELHGKVESIVGGIAGIGELYVYDTALRIGAKLRLLPEHVYIHAGVREGARACGFEPSRRRIGMHELPTALRQLEPYEVEDIFCIYKSQIAGAAVDARRRHRC